MPVAAPEHSLLHQLRVATRADHAAIEAALGLDGSFDLDKYITALQGFDAFLHWWEPCAAAALPARLRPWFEARRRGHLARADLALLRAPTRHALFTAPRMQIQSAAQAWGGLYVMEGSSLGAQVIAKRLADRLGIGVDNGGAFFGTRGAAIAPLWREFCVQIELEVGTDITARDQACRAAVQVFVQLRAMFDAGRPHPPHLASSPKEW